MEDHVLITGGSGYLGGTLLNRLNHADLPKHKLYALVRSAEQAKAVEQYGAEPLLFDAYNENDVLENVLKYKLNIIFHLIDAFKPDSQVAFIRALKRLKDKTGQCVNFVHTSGAKMISNHAGAPIDRPVYDNEEGFYETLKALQAPIPLIQTGIDTNLTVTEEGDKRGVVTYIFLPCMVYGKGEGFGNTTSIQDVAIVKVAKAVGKVFKVDEGVSTWPVCSLADTTALYLCLLEKMLRREKIPSGKKGYYLASSGNVTWEEVYSAIASAMYKNGVVEDAKVHQADDAVLEKMAEVLNCPKELVAPQLSGMCTFEARNGKELGWKPQHLPQHMLQSIEVEVEHILQHI